LSLELPLDGDKGITVRAANTVKPVLVSDISKDSAYVGVGLHMRSELAVPIKIGNKVVGVLNAEREEVNAFDEKDQELLEILASHAATAISNLEYAKNLEAYAQEIRESQQKFEGLFMANPEAAVHVGSDFCILNVNPRFEILFGYKLDEIKGRSINDVVVPKDKIDEAQTLDLKAEQDKHVSLATMRRKKDGSLVPVFVSAAPITVESRFLGYVAVYKDISELKSTEKKLELMNEKLRVTGGLTRHDVRNKLSTVTGNAYLLKKRLADDSNALDKLKAMENAVQQTVRIFDFAKAYEMLGVEELSYIDVAKTFDEAASLFPSAINVKVVNELYGLIVLADPLLRQLFYNLIDNSLKYGQKISRIRVHYEGAGPNDLRLIYEDDGVGISATEKPKLFKQGYSTGGSTGYGLYLISKIVEVYGWTIQETGNPGQGAQFTITIPKVNKDGKENLRLS
jgi:PAS domain S-box-containing protein